MMSAFIFSNLLTFVSIVQFGFILKANAFKFAPNNAGTRGAGMLYPRDSESRQSKFLDGIWLFRVDESSTRNKSFVDQWWKKPLSESGPVIDMPVPASYNDVTEDKSLRDFVGWAWYEKSFYVSSDWALRRVMLRFDSAHYYTIVWVNGEQLMEHNGGHLPFEAEVGNFLAFKGLNRVTVAINNTLSPTTLPPGSIDYGDDTSRYPPGYFVQNLQMDFFNYAGIHRHVRLYSTPKSFIDDIIVVTEVVGSQGIVSYEISCTSAYQATNITVSVLDAKGQVVANSSKISDKLYVDNAHLWWPFGMNDSIGYLYLLEVKAGDDVYREPFGIRTVRVTQDKILINDKPFYCHGVAKHEDSDLRGKGLDYTLITKDFNMLRWLGVNCIRTSHYPYAEEILHLADRQGVAVIDESPGVGIKYPSNMGNVSLTHHLEVMSEMVRRDKNKPSVIMWSIANEPGSDLVQAVDYFKPILEHTKSIDPSRRPVTFVSDKRYNTDKVVPYVDVICINRYYAWYSDPGHTELIQRQMQHELDGFRGKYTKPIIITEYGADTVPGLHREPSFMFTEEYQKDFLQEYHQVFDKNRKTFLAGEMVWNFADFMTIQGVRRVVGNKKGLLTRQRQPKSAAFIIRNRYHALAKGQDPAYLYTLLDNCPKTSTHMYVEDERNEALRFNKLQTGERLKMKEDFINFQEDINLVIN